MVDDSLLIRALERGILESVGFEVAVAADGREALELYRRRGDFDVVLTDLVMPNMDGLQLTRLLRQDQHGGRVPIIMLTAQNSPGGCQAAAEAGVDRYLVKADFGREQLLSAIEELIG